jgi:hypothetical protein
VARRVLGWGVGLGLARSWGGDGVVVVLLWSPCFGAAVRRR